MSHEVLERIGDEVLTSEVFGPDTLILWHAGEPLVVPVAWYERAYQTLQARVGRKLRFQFQTNGTLINEAWIQFFLETRSGITLSIDGPEALHNSRRVDRQGNGTHQRIMHSATLLKAAGIPFSCIAVVTSASLDRADEIFAFFQELDPISVGFSTEEAEGANARSSVYHDDCLGQIQSFFARITELNMKAERPLRIREIEHVLRPLREGAQAKVQNQECALAAMTTIAADGTVAFFSPENLTTIRENGAVFSAGNIMSMSFQSMLNSAAVVRMQSEIERGVENCRQSCRYFRFCGGGAPSNKFLEHGHFEGTETWHCRATKQAVVRGIVGQIGRIQNEGR
jgi:uncharacterized protein